MSELIETLEKLIEIVDEEDYRIDTVVMTKSRATYFLMKMRNALEDLLNEIKVEFPLYDTHYFRRIITSTVLTRNTEYEYAGEMWNVIKCSPYIYGGYEIFLKREK